MELCEGGSLFEQIEVQKERVESIPEDKVLQMAAQLLDGLRYLHDHRIVHRGIKPSSILLTQEQNLKFGELMLRAETQTYFSARNVQVESYDEQTDIFQLGCVLYFVCAFVHPFEANDDQAIVAMQSSEMLWTKRIVDFTYKRIPETYSDELNDIIARMLFQKDQDSEPSANRLLKEIVDHQTRRQPASRSIQIQQMEQGRSRSRISIQRHDHELGPHEVRDQQEDGSETHRGLLNRRKVHPQFSNEDVYYETDKSMDQKTFQNLLTKNNRASGGV